MGDILQEFLDEFKKNGYVLSDELYKKYITDYLDNTFEFIKDNNAKEHIYKVIELLTLDHNRNKSALYVKINETIENNISLYSKIYKDQIKNSSKVVTHFENYILENITKSVIVSSTEWIMNHFIIKNYLKDTLESHNCLNKDIDVYFSYEVIRLFSILTIIISNVISERFKIIINEVVDGYINKDVKLMKKYEDYMFIIDETESFFTIHFGEHLSQWQKFDKFHNKIITGNFIEKDIKVLFYEIGKVDNSPLAISLMDISKQYFNPELSSREKEELILTNKHTICEVLCNIRDNCVKFANNINNNVNTFEIIKKSSEDINLVLNHGQFDKIRKKYYTNFMTSRV